MSLTKALAEKIVATTEDTIPKEIFVINNQWVLDALSVAVAGALQQGPQILSSYIKDQGGNPLASTIGFGFKTSQYYAAYLNAVSMHVLDFEPHSNPGNHPTSPTLPGILAVAETRDFDGKKLATAMIKGVEMQYRLQFAMGRLKRNRFHPPGVVGAMGGAVAVGHLLGLNVEQVRWSLGIAGSRSGTLIANQGTMTKATHLGMAAAQGFEAASLAARGFTARAEVLEHPFGFNYAFMEQGVNEEGLLGYATKFRIIESGYAIKLFPSQYPTHWGINAALDLRKLIPAGEDLKSIDVYIPHFQDVDRPTPKSGLDGKFSVQYTVSSALIDGKVGIDTFTDQALARPEIQATLKKIKLHIDESRPHNTADATVIIKAETTSGKQIESKCVVPPGHFTLPMLPHERHLSKVNDCLGLVFNAPEREEIISLANSFYELKSADVKRLIQILARPAIA